MLSRAPLISRCLGTGNALAKKSPKYSLRIGMQIRRPSSLVFKYCNNTSRRVDCSACLGATEVEKEDEKIPASDHNGLQKEIVSSESLEAEVLSRTAALKNEEKTATNGEPMASGGRRKWSRVVTLPKSQEEDTIVKDQGKPMDRKEMQKAETVENEENVDDKELLRRKRISEANSGKVPWNKGRKHSEETKRKIRERTRLAMSRPEVKAKVKSCTNHRTKQSEATKQKIKAKLNEFHRKRREMHNEQMTKLHGPNWEQKLKDDAAEVKRLKQQAKREEREKIRAAKKKQLTAEAKQSHQEKISEALKEKWKDPAYREKVSAGMRKAREKNPKWTGGSSKPRARAKTSKPKTGESSSSDSKVVTVVNTRRAGQAPEKRGSKRTARKNKAGTSVKKNVVLGGGSRRVKGLSRGSLSTGIGARLGVGSAAVVSTSGVSNGGGGVSAKGGGSKGDALDQERALTSNGEGGGGGGSLEDETHPVVELSREEVEASRLQERVERAEMMIAEGEKAAVQLEMLAEQTQLEDHIKAAQTARNAVEEARESLMASMGN